MASNHPDHSHHLHLPKFLTEFHLPRFLTEHHLCELHHSHHSHQDKEEAAMALSKRGQNSHDFPNFHFDWGFKCLGNLYHEDSNPQGMLNFGFAESTLVEDILQDRLNKPDMQNFEPWMAHYFEVRGIKSFRQALAKFLTQRFKAVTPVDADHLIVTSGCGSAFDLLSHVFVDQGESFLCLAPYYSVIKPDVAIRNTGIHCYPIQLSPTMTIETPSGNCFRRRPLPVETKPFGISRQTLDRGMRNAKRKGHRIKAIIMLNPNNPTGDVYTREEISTVLDFAAANDIHAIFDEIYGLSTFDNNKKFTSVLSIDHLPKPHMTHMMWGFSKDFTLAGFRCGVLYTRNPKIPLATRHLSYMAAVPAEIQEKCRKLIEDKDWLDNVYFPTNHKRMRESYKFVVDRLTSMRVEVHPSQAGFFVWANFNKFLKTVTPEGEIKFFERIFYRGIFMLPGTTMGFEHPGWFRINFTIDMNHLELGMDRLEKILETLEY